MDNLYKFHYLSEETWLLHDTSRDIKSQSLNESLFSMGNGNIGSRGVYEEIPLKSHPGTYFAGLFNHDVESVAELINAPNPFQLAIDCGGEPLAIYQTAVEAHQRTLDMNKGLLHRRTVFKTKRNARFEYQSLRFISMADLHIAVMTASIVSLNGDETINIDTRIDVDVHNIGDLTHSQLFHIQEIEQLGTIHLLGVQSLDLLNEISYAQQTIISYKSKLTELSALETTLTIEKNKPLVITKYIAYATSKDICDPTARRQFVVDRLKKAVHLSFSGLISQHINAYQKRWDKLDIQIVGDDKTQTALRFNLFQLLIAAHVDLNNTSIGAKMLTGEGYRGHIFWDTEMLLLPPFLFSEPKIARNLLLYRFNRLAEAVKISAALQYQGALYPWESADGGRDETPKWSKDLDGTITEVHTGRLAIHINLAIDHAINNYFNSTHDIDFMLHVGLPMMIEMSRFWQSRVVPKQDKYSILHVMGPDEFHVDINDDFYTNKLVSCSLSRLLALIDQLQSSHPDEVAQLLKKYEVSVEEKARIKEISENIYLPFQDNLLVQFDGYLSLKPTQELTLDAHGLPTIPADVLVADLGSTQYVKQPEIILLFLLLPGQYDQETINKNFHFYDSKTLHKSSWSPPITSAVAAKLGFLDEAAHYLRLTLNTDLQNIFANSQEGNHAPAVGGSWVAMIHGFLGVAVLEDRMVINPKLPQNWDKVSCKLYYLDFYLHFMVEPRLLTVAIEPAHLNFDRPSKTGITLQVGEQVMQLDLDGRYPIGVAY